MSCTAVHLRSRWMNIVSLSDMIEGSYRSWNLYTTGQLVDGLQQKKKKKKKEKKEKKTGFHSTEMESCRLSLGDNFIVPPCKSTLYRSNTVVEGESPWRRGLRTGLRHCSKRVQNLVP